LNDRIFVGVTIKLASNSGQGVSPFDRIGRHDLIRFSAGIAIEELIEDGLYCFVLALSALKRSVINGIVQFNFKSPGSHAAVSSRK
jgi:hypothetical protein